MVAQVVRQIVLMIKCSSILEFSSAFSSHYLLTFQDVALDQLLGRGSHGQSPDEACPDRLLGLLELVVVDLVQDVAVDQVLLVRSELQLQGQRLLAGQFGQPGVVVVLVPVDDMAIAVVTIAAAFAYHKWPGVLLVLHGARQLDVEHLLPAVG